jgi:hypothetical protein
MTVVCIHIARSLLGSSSGAAIRSVRQAVHYSINQKEGIGLVEYQAMPSLRDVAHDGWLCAFIISAHSLTAPDRATGTVQKRQGIWPIYQIQNHTCQVNLVQPARRAAVLDQTCGLRPY